MNVNELRNHAWNQKLKEESLIDPIFDSLPRTRPTPPTAQELEERAFERRRFERRATAFLAEYETLCKRYGLCIHASGYDEPMVAVIPATDPEVVAHIEELRQDL
jgi:hypothetical protein